MEINVGTVVQLKSGGPKMTVQNKGDYEFSGGAEDGALCSWFAGDEHKSEVFDCRSLRVCEDEQ